MYSVIFLVAAVASVLANQDQIKLQRAAKFSIVISPYKNSNHARGHPRSVEKTIIQDTGMDQWKVKTVCGAALHQ